MSTQCPKCSAENPDTKQFCGDCGTPLEVDVVHTKTIETPTEELKRGSVFAGRYEIIEELGKGGMGKVYRVEDRKAKEEIALKLIKPEIAADRKTIERFRHELTTARKIVQKNVCRMYDIGEEKGQHFITMEYVSGGDLKRFIRRVGQLPTGKAISIAKQICDGLEEAHSLGIVHRDLKPNNIMIDDNGNAKIMDFGIARTVKEKGITGSGVMIGTPEYMSPEQAEAKDVDHRSDIYSLGVILYEMTTGRLPFEGDTSLAVAMKHKGETPKDPREFNTQISEDLAGVILRCLEKEKSDRYQNTLEVRSELEKIEQGLPTTERVEPKTRSLTSREITVQFKLKKILIPVSIILTALLVGLLLLWRKAPQFEDNKVVVTTFINRTGDSNLDNIGIRVADIISQGLKKIGSINVGPVAEFDFNGENIIEEKHYRAVSKNTQAAIVISGEFYLQGENLSFQSNIYNAQETKLMPSPEAISGQLSDPTAAMEGLRNSLMSAVLSISEPFLQQYLVVSSYVPKYEAVIEFIKGGELFMVREYDESIESFNRATSIDSNYFLAYYLAAWAHINRGRFAEAELLFEATKKIPNLSRRERLAQDSLEAYFEGDNEKYFQVSLEADAQVPGTAFSYSLALLSNRTNRPHLAVEALLRVDPEGVYMKGWEAYWDVLTTAYHMIGDHKQELKSALKSQKQYPESWRPLEHQVEALGAMGNIDRIKEIINESYTRPPTASWHPARIIYFAGIELKAHGYNKDAEEMFKLVLDWLNDHQQEVSQSVNLRGYLGMAFFVNQNLIEAEDVFRGLYEEYPESISYLGNIGLILARKGEREEAQKISDQILNLNKPFMFGSDSYWRAIISACLGEKDKAVGLLRKAISEGITYNALYCNIRLEPLWDYPAFVEFLKPKE